MMIYTQQYAILEYHTQFGSTIYNEIFDLTAGVYLCLYNNQLYRNYQIIKIASS